MYLCIPPNDKGGNDGVIESGSKPKEINNWNLSIHYFSKPTIICSLWISSHESIFHNLVALINLLLHAALIVVPDFPARTRKYSSNGKQIFHLFWLKDATLRVYERNALTFIFQPCSNMLIGNLSMDLGKQLHMLEGFNPQCKVRIISWNREQSLRIN